MASTATTLADTYVFKAITATDGSGILLLSAANVTGSHTLPDGVLSTNVPLLNAGNAVALGTITTSQPQSITETWNASGVTFEAFKVVVTNTASASASKAIVVNVGGSDVAYIDRTGKLFCTGASLSLSNVGVTANDITASYFVLASTRGELGNNLPGLWLRSDQLIAWSSSATNYTTDSETVLVRAGVNTVGVRANSATGVAPTIELQGKSSTTAGRKVGTIVGAWVTSTDASRTGRATINASDAAGDREGVRVEASGSAPMISFYGATAVVKPTVSGAKGGNAALGSLMTALAALGLVTDSTSA